MSSAMDEKNPQRSDIDRFLFAEVDSIPHLEAILLVWKSRPKKWSADELSRSIYVPLDRAHAIIYDLRQREIVNLEADECWYNPEYRHNWMISEVAEAYRRELVRITNLIHSKASPAVREFARAFRFKKD
jgi:hypothetical protein